MDSDAPLMISEGLQALSGRLASDAVDRNVPAQPGLLAYERARADGLCHEGAWECALETMRSYVSKPRPEQG